MLPGLPIPSLDWRRALVVTDLDGTLLLPDRTLPAESREAMRAFMRRGGRLAFATARNLHSLRQLGGLTGAEDAIPSNLPCALSNGAITVDWPTGRHLRIHRLGLETAHRLVDILSRHGFNPIAHRLEEDAADAGEEVLFKAGEFSDADRTCRSVRPGDPYLRAVPDLAAALTGREHYMTTVGTPSAIEALAADVEAMLDGAVHPHHYADIYHPGYAWVEIVARDAGKANFVRWLRDTAGSDACAVVAIGDGGNDAPMLRAADLGIAVANAAEVTRTAADVVLPWANTDGAVAHLLEGILGEWPAR